jgi:hypothetical protein
MLSLGLRLWVTRGLAIAFPIRLDVSVEVSPRVALVSDSVGIFENIATRGIEVLI